MTSLKVFFFYQALLFGVHIIYNCGVCSDLSWDADGFMCRCCDGTIPEVDLAEGLMVDGDTYECVKNFCYL